MKNYLLLFFIFLVSVSFSQNQYSKHRNQDKKIEIYGKVSGFVKDFETKTILSYASVTLLKTTNNADTVNIVNGTISNEKGYFVFDNLSIGDYVVEVSYNGYVSQDISFSISPRKLNKNLKSIFLKIDTYLLDDVKLSTEAPIYENKIEKIVYNVENDIDQSANDGIDVLRNAPLVTVDIEDKVSLRGSENVKFLLNGKSSSFLN